MTSVSLTHAIPIDNHHVTLPQIIHYKILSSAAVHAKKATSVGTLSC